MNRIVHLGLGAFHRAHQAVYTADAGGDWEICGVAWRSRTVADALRTSGGRYRLIERGPVEDCERQIGITPRRSSRRRSRTRSSSGWPIPTPES